jgi:hypothetical protein
MALSKRSQIVLPGGVVMLVLALVMTSMSLLSFFRKPSVVDVLFFGACVVGAPPFLLWHFATRDTFGTPVETFTAAVIAIVAVPAHPLLPRPFTAAISIIGLLAWFFCAVIVAGAPA